MTMLEKMAAAIGDQHTEGDSLEFALAALMAIREPDLKMRQAATTFTGADIDWPAMIDAILEGKA
jgi:hypothetical protein